MVTPYPAIVPTIVDGTSVSASTTNQPIQALISRTDHLKELVDQISTVYQTLVLRQQPVENSVTEHKFVYYNKTTSKFDLAVAELVSLGIPPVFDPSDRTFAVGLAKNITGIPGSRKADIFLYGPVDVTAGDLIEGSATIGDGEPYYLTNISANAGRMTNVKPVLEVILGQFISGATKFFLKIDVKNLGENHLHYNFQLDPTKWLNMGTEYLYPDTELDPFPPIPPESAVLTVNGILQRYGEVFTIDADGVHWLNLDFTPVDIQIDGSNPSIDLYYIIPAAETSPGVTSLKAGNDNVIVENCSPGGPANIGDLQVSVFNQIDLVENKDGFNVIKQLTTDLNTGHLVVSLGPVVEQILIGPGIKISPSNGQGKVTISAGPSDFNEILLSDISLRNAKESSKGVTTYIEFLKSVKTGIVGKIKLPKLLNTAKDLKISVEYLGEASVGGDGRFQVKYLVTEANARVDRPTTSVSGSLVFPATYVNFTRLVSDLVAIPGSVLKPEATLAFSIDRLNTDSFDTYSSNIGLLHITVKVPV